MSKIMTRWMANELKSEFAGIEGGVVVNFAGLDSKKTYDLRTALRAQNIHVTVVKNTIAKQAPRHH